MANNAKVSPRDRQIKKINSAARHKANQRGKKEQEDMDRCETQRKL